jgi:hypothetical protein
VKLGCGRYGTGFAIFPGSGLAASGSYIDKAFTCCGAIIMVAANSEITAIAVATMISVTEIFYYFWNCSKILGNTNAKEMGKDLVLHKNSRYYNTDNNMVKSLSVIDNI